MSVTVAISILIVSAIGGWITATLFIAALFRPFKEKNLAGFLVHGMFPANKEKVATEITKFLTGNFSSQELILKSISGETALQKLQPEIEMQVDLFLKEKLKLAFPLMHQMMGEKTMAKFKEIFLEEVEVLFPALIEKYASEIMNAEAIEKHIKEVVDSISPEKAEAIFTSGAKQQLFKVKIAAACAGLLIGIVQIIIVLLLSQNR